MFATQRADALRLRALPARTAYNFTIKVAPRCCEGTCAVHSCIVLDSGAVWMQSRCAI
jgi:hypothetical protein